MSIGRGATRDSDQVSGLQARESTAPVLLYFIVQDGLKPPLGKSLPHVSNRCRTHIEGICKLCGTPSLGGFEQDAGTR
jgi:hypothetical protein